MHTTENVTIIPKHVAVLINYTFIYFMCQFGWFNRSKHSRQYVDVDGERFQHFP